MVGSPEHVQHVILVLVDAGDLETRELVELLDVVANGGLGSRVVELRLQQLVLELLELRGLLVAELRLDEVLRVQPDLSVRLPDPEALHPAPLAPACVGRADTGLESEQRALGEQLDRADRLLDARAVLAGRHLDVDQEMGE